MGRSALEGNLATVAKTENAPSFDPSNSTAWNLPSDRLQQRVKNTLESPPTGD